MPLWCLSACSEVVYHVLLESFCSFIGRGYFHIENKISCCRKNLGVLNAINFFKVNAILFMRWRKALCNRHVGGDCKTLIGALKKVKAAECIRKDEKSLCCRKAKD